MNRNMGPRPSRNPWFLPGISAAIFGSVVVIFLFAIDQLSKHYGLSESLQIFDDFCGGIIAGLLIYRYERGRSKYLNERLKTIELMNHHVRNALNVIVASVYVHGHDKELNELQISVNRIEWALREVLPGRVLDDYDEHRPEEKTIERPFGGVVSRPMRSRPNWRNIAITLIHRLRSHPVLRPKQPSVHR
jgi:hypothetical protein